MIFLKCEHQILDHDLFVTNSFATLRIIIYLTAKDLHRNSFLILLS